MIHSAKGKSVTLGLLLVLLGLTAQVVQGACAGTDVIQLRQDIADIWIVENNPTQMFDIFDATTTCTNFDSFQICKKGATCVAWTVGHPTVEMISDPAASGGKKMNVKTNALLQEKFTIKATSGAQEYSTNEFAVYINCNSG